MTLAKQACDCCRVRRVKCDGEKPCNRCLQHDLKCTYLQPLRKRGPKNIRSRSLKKIAETQTFSENNNCMTALEISIGIIISYMLFCSVVVTNFQRSFRMLLPLFITCNFNLEISFFPHNFSVAFLVRINPPYNNSILLVFSPMSMQTNR